MGTLGCRAKGWVVCWFRILGVLGFLSVVPHFARATPIVEKADALSLPLPGVSAAPARRARHPLTLAVEDVMSDASDVSLVEKVEGCGGYGSCYRTIQVSEPQSLTLLGSGLLSMAVFFRRRIQH